MDGEPYPKPRGWRIPEKGTASDVAICSQPNPMVSGTALSRTVGEGPGRRGLRPWSSCFRTMKRCLTCRRECRRRASRVRVLTFLRAFGLKASGGSRFFSTASMNFDGGWIKPWPTLVPLIAGTRPAYRTGVGDLDRQCRLCCRSFGSCPRGSCAGTN